MLALKKIKIGFLNCCSLGSNHDEFFVTMEKHKVDIIGLNETWLRTGQDGRAPILPGYRLRHIPRSTEVRARGGGVGFYIRRDISVRMITPPFSAMVEQMWLSININTKLIVIGTAYRPPWLNVQSFIDALTDTIASVGYYDHLVLVGDFNINLLDYNSTKSLLFREFLEWTNLKQYVNDATHYSTPDGTLLGLICTNAKVNRVWVDYVSELSNHAFIARELDIRRPKFMPKKYILGTLRT